MPGLVDHATGTVLHAVNLGIGDTPGPLTHLLAEELGGVPVTADNDLNAAAAGAAHVLGPPGRRRLPALGTGVAAGFLLDGRVRRGWLAPRGRSATSASTGRPACACGQRGCLELSASGASLDAALADATASPPPAALFAAAAAGDPRAAAVRDDFAGGVARPCGSSC